MIYYASTNTMKHNEAIYQQNEIQGKNITRDKEEHYLVVK